LREFEGFSGALAESVSLSEYFDRRDEIDIREAVDVEVLRS
jgi:hypothetical protein